VKVVQFNNVQIGKLVAAFL